MKYKCIETFQLEMCDDDGFSIENKYMSIKKDSVWENDDDEDMIIGGEIRLQCYDKKSCSWIEITSETLKSYFEIIE